MTNQTRREFLGKLGWMFAGSLLAPYIPKTFYSIPAIIKTPKQLYYISQDKRWGIGPMTEWDYNIINGICEKQDLVKAMGILNPDNLWEWRKVVSLLNAEVLI